MSEKVFCNSKLICYRCQLKKGHFGSHKHVIYFNLEWDNEDTSLSPLVACKKPLTKAKEGRADEFSSKNASKALPYSSKKRKVK